MTTGGSKKEEKRSSGKRKKPSAHGQCLDLELGRRNKVRIEIEKALGMPKRTGKWKKKKKKKATVARLGEATSGNAAANVERG